MNKEKMKRQLKLDGTVLLTTVLVLLFFQMTGIGCPIRHFLGFPCPSCGISRSFFALFQGDFSRSLYYHALTIPTLLILALFLHQDFFPFLKRGLTVIGVLWAITLLGYYFYRLSMGIIP